ncbi:MAG TPA: hypothetical protein VFC23_07670 [Thermoanaerobaculia bacterium]|nr:hypothetical protein [Thermoanaerobaculia bacterium]
MSLTMLDLNSDARGQSPTYSTEPVSPLPKLWIGFLLAFGFLVAEIVDAMQGKAGEIHGAYISRRVRYAVAEHEQVRVAAGTFA